MDIKIVEPEDGQLQYFRVIAVFESGEEVFVIGLRSKHDAECVAHKLRIICREAEKSPRKRKKKDSKEIPKQPTGEQTECAKAGVLVRQTLLRQVNSNGLQN